VSSLGSIPLSFIVPSRILFLMWLIFFIELNLGINLSIFGILPREPLGLLGVLLAPLLHGSIVHLVSNTLPLLLLGTTLYYFYGKLAKRVFLLSYFLTGALVWLFGRTSFHIGASGLIYGIASFLFFSGIVRAEFKSLVISIAVVIGYGGLVWGVLPTIPGISWESHLSGVIVGGVVAFAYRNKQIE
jgi:membrane associated rhomboid family serine protease